MKYEILTDRFEIEKLAEELYISKDNIFVYIDYADVCAIKRLGTFKYTVICDIDMQNESWVTAFINVIQSLDFPLDELKAFMVNFIEGGEECTLIQTELCEVLQFLQSMTFTEERPNNYIDILWSVRNRPSMSKGTLKIQLLATYEKTEQDKLEDEKYEQMMEEYRKPFFPPVDLPEFGFTPTNNE